jgi:hypothetical protein
MGKQKGVAAPQHTQEEKIALAKQVCDLYESQNCTLESACESVGLPQATFYLWKAQIVEIGEYYKKAKENADEFYWHELLRPKLKTSLQLLVEGFDEVHEMEEDVVWQGVMVKDDNDKPMRKNKITKSRVAPNPTSVIFGMKVVFPEKTKDRADVTSDGKQIGQNPLDGLSIEDKAQILRILLKKDADR